MTTRPRGYALPFVILMLLILAVATATLLFVLTAGARSTEAMVGRRKLFYACDGLGRVAALAAQDYLGSVASPTSAGMRAFVCAAGGGCPNSGDPENPSPQLPTFVAQNPGFMVRSFDIDAVSRLGNEKLSNGPFAGMNALQDSVHMRLDAAKIDSGWECAQDQELVLGKIAMFQFFIFSDVTYTEWTPGPPMTATGRVHANGSAGLCIGGNNTLHTDRITVSTPGQIHNRNNESTGCRPDTDGDDGKVFIATNDSAVFDPAPTASTANFAEFVTRSNPGFAAFNGHLADEVPKLRLPVIGTPEMQNGTQSDATVVSNAGTSRFLVDPPWVTERGNPASESVRTQKFACKADLRIINGAWYVRPDGDTTCASWPGTAIWSDHPLSFTTPAASPPTEEVETPNRAIGQNDIASAQSWSTRPVRYSSYVFNSAGALQAPSSTVPSVVSYGPLFRDTSAPASSTNPVWKPGFRSVTDCVSVSPFTCGVSAATTAAQLLKGARAGIRLGTAEQYFGFDLLGTNNPLVIDGNLLPINFNVAAFQQALATTSNNELGSYFPGTSGGSGRVFNGIVWITSTWHNSSGGRSGSARAAIVPPQGLRDDANQPAVGVLSPATAVTSAEQRALPYPLCGGTAGATMASSPTFKVPDCASYAFTSSAPSTTSMINARPNAVRIYNARNLNTEAAVDAPDIAANMLPRGLTIVSNLPTFLLGDVNTSSVAEPETATPWVPMLVGGDMVYLLSNAWDDARSSWGLSMSLASRTPVQTTYNTAILAGWNTTTVADSPSDYWSGGLHNFPKFQEDWGGIKAKIRGSMVVGWNSVYVQWPFHCCGNISYQAPNRDWGFDKHLNVLLNQPPGAPLFDVSAIRSWSR